MAPPTPDVRASRGVALACSLVVALALLPGAAAATPQDADRVVGSDETVSGDLTVVSGDVSSAAPSTATSGRSRDPSK